VPKDATPILGLIQDHVVSGVLMTMRGRFFGKEDFMHLLLAAFGTPTQRIKMPKPAMLKPKKLWTGKQVIRLPR
jgi:DNA-directed RNA polymerase I subunit RPA1